MNDIVYETVFISPHLDDVIFSCSNLLSQHSNHQKCVVITLFTAAPNYRSDDPFLDYRTRVIEDNQAMAHLGLDHINLDFEEFMVRNRMRRINFFGSIIPTLKELLWRNSKLEESIYRKLKYYLDSYKPKMIYYPCGMGNHPDHVIARRVCDRLTNICKILYEDFPHNTYLNRMVYSLTHKNNLNKIELDCDSEEKSKQISFYKTQIERMNILAPRKEIYYLDA